MQLVHWLEGAIKKKNKIQFEKASVASAYDTVSTVCAHENNEPFKEQRNFKKKKKKDLSRQKQTTAVSQTEEINFNNNDKETDVKLRPHKCKYEII